MQCQEPGPQQPERTPWYLRIASTARQRYAPHKCGTVAAIEIDLRNGGASHSGTNPGRHSARRRATSFAAVAIARAYRVAMALRATSHRLRFVRGLSSVHCVDLSVSRIAYLTNLG